MTHRRLPVILAFMLAVVVCTACESNMATELTLERGNRYQVQSVLTVPDAISRVVLQRLQEQAAQAQKAGARASYRQEPSGKSGQAIYVLQITGTGYDRAPFKDYFSALPIPYGERQALRLELTPGTMMLQAAAGTLKLTVNDGEILQTNGQQIAPDTVTWSILRPDAYAILAWKEPPPTDFRLYLVIGAGVLTLLIVVAVIVVLVRRRSASPRRSGSVFCPNCRASVSRGTRLCPRCHRPLPLR